MGRQRARPAQTAAAVGTTMPGAATRRTATTPRTIMSNPFWASASLAFRRTSEKSERSGFATHSQAAKAICLECIVPSMQNPRRTALRATEPPDSGESLWFRWLEFANWNLPPGICHRLTSSSLHVRIRGIAFDCIPASYPHNDLQNSATLCDRRIILWYSHQTWGIAESSFSLLAMKESNEDK